MKLNLLTFLPLAAAAVQTALAATTPIRRDEWPHGPFKTEGNQVKNANGEPVIFVGTNWPGSGETTIPEGIEFRSIADIVSMMKYVGYNFVRHTYPIQMIDQIYENNGTDITVQHALLYALGEDNGTRIMEMINKNNPQITNSTTRLEVYSMIAEEEKKQGMLMHLDNHISRAIWCCSHDDGNAWFGDMDFDVSKWHRGHRYMAEWAKKHSNIVSMSLRNELRKSAVKPGLEYNWNTWVANAESLPPVYADIANTKFGKANKAVLELHACPPAKITLPTLLTEFGDAQDSSYGNVIMQKCLRDFTTKNKIGWAHWSLAGSYHIRQNVVFNNDSWGLTNPTWTEYQSKEMVDGFFRPWIQDMGKTNLEL
ncbi:hypothetical protein NDA17_002816 [Ustilago hordei]|nr:hypothetical protein NDA17_002816 [Ustilago hordei]